MQTNDSNATVDEFELAKFDEEFASADTKDLEQAPDGDYQVSVERVEITRARTSGNAMLRWALRIISGEHAGRLLRRHNMILTPDNLKWLKRDLHTCGLEISTLSELPQNLGKLLDVTLEVAKRTRGENSNVYINRRIEIPGGNPAAHDARQQF